jgi:hypothetical protein
LASVAKTEQQQQARKPVPVRYNSFFLFFYFVSLSPSVFTCLFVFISFVCLAVYQSICLLVYISIFYQFLCLFCLMCTSVCLFVCLCGCFYASFRYFIFLSGCPDVFPSGPLYFCLPIFL